MSVFPVIEMGHVRISKHVNFHVLWGMGHVRMAENVNFHVCLDGSGVFRIQKKGLSTSVVVEMGQVRISETVNWVLPVFMKRQVPCPFWRELIMLGFPKER